MGTAISETEAAEAEQQQQQEPQDPLFVLPGIDESLLELQELSHEVERQLQQKTAPHDALASSQPQVPHKPKQQQQQHPRSAPSTRKPPYREPLALPAAGAAPTSLSPRARNPKLVGRQAVPYATASAAALQAARSTGAVGPQDAHTSALLKLGGPGPLGSPLAKLMHKCSKGPASSELTTQQDSMPCTGKPTQRSSAGSGVTAAKGQPKWAQPRDASSVVRQAGQQQQQQRLAGSAGGAAKLASTLPGQWQFREVQARALQDALTRPRGLGSTGATHTFQKEMESLNVEIDAYLEEERFVRAAPGAATVLQASWRARGPRLMFAEYQRQCVCASSAKLRAYFEHLRLLVGALRHWRHSLVARCFREWQEMGALKMELYKKVLQRLKASMIDVRDSQSPSHLWRLCMVEGQDPWVAHISLGALCRNLIIGQAPRRKLVSYFTAWRERLLFKTQVRQRAAALLRHMQARHDRSRMLMLFRFWFRWSVVHQSERLGLTTPLFRPPLMIWDAWLSSHNRTKNLEAHIPKLHWGFRVRHCFQFWHFFTTRNKRMRVAWVASAANQIEAILRQCVNCLKANWHEARQSRHLCRMVLKEWARVARRNVLVRMIAAEVKVVSRRTSLKQSFRMLREWTSMSSMLSASGCIQMWQRRALCLIPLFAWTGDFIHMWFVSVWHAWRNHVIGRLRFRCLVGMHIERIGLLGQRAMGLRIELCFRAWAKAARAQALLRAQVAKFHLKHSRKQQQGDATGQAPAATPRSRGSSHQPPLQEQGTDSNAALACGFESGSDSGEDVLWTNPGPPVWKEHEVELEDGSVLVNLSDFPSASPYRPLLQRSGIVMASTGQPSKRQLDSLIAELKNVDGRFKPGLVNKQQYVFEGLGGGRQPMNTTMKGYLSSGREDSLGGWWVHQEANPEAKPAGDVLSESRDPWLWQRIVGLMGCRLQPHSEAPISNLATSTSLPFAEEIGAVKRWQYRDRMRLPIIVVEEAQEEGEEAQEKVSQARERRKSIEFLRSYTPGTQHAGCSWWGALDVEPRGLMWLYKLAEAEEVLETSAVWLMNLQGKQLPAFYEVLLNRRAMCLGAHAQVQLKRLSQAAGRDSMTPTSPLSQSDELGTLPDFSPPGHISCCRQGDLLAWLLRGAIKHDGHFSSIVLSHAVNRDRVITTGSSLSVYAHALHSHCPEFTLTRPLSGRMTTWLDVVARVDNEDSRPTSGQQEGDAAAAGSTPGNTRNISPKSRRRNTKRRGTVAEFYERGLIPLAANKGPSKSDLIRMEMEGVRASKLSTIEESKSQDGKEDEARKIARARSSLSQTGSGSLSGTGNGFARRQGLSLSGTLSSSKQVRGREDTPQSPVNGKSNRAHFQAPWRPTGVQKSSAPIFSSSSRTISHKPRVSGSPLKACSMAGSGFGLETQGSNFTCPDPQLSPLQQGAAPGQGTPGWDNAPGSWLGRGSLPGNLFGAASMASPLGHAGSSALLIASEAEGALCSPSGSPGRQAPWDSEGGGEGEGQGKKEALPPYLWLAGPGRIFDCVTDVEVPMEPASMHELHHRANRLAGQDLANNLFAVPLIPALVFQEWGEPSPEALWGEDGEGAEPRTGDDKRPSPSVSQSGHAQADGEAQGPPDDGQGSPQHARRSSLLSAVSGSSGGGLQLTEEQLKELEALQDQGDTDMRVALRMVKDDAAYELYKEQGVNNRIRQGMEGYISTRFLPKCGSASSNPLNRTRASDSGDDEYLQEEQEKLAAQLQQRQAGSAAAAAATVTARPSSAPASPRHGSHTVEALPEVGKEHVASPEGPALLEGRPSVAANRASKDGSEQGGLKKASLDGQWQDLGRELGLGLRPRDAVGGQAMAQWAGAEEWGGGESQGGIPEEDSRAVEEHHRHKEQEAALYRRRPPVKRPVFQATAHQLNVFLGGHVGGAKRNLPLRRLPDTPPAAAVGAASEAAAQAAEQAGTAQQGTAAAPPSPPPRGAATATGTAAQNSGGGAVGGIGASPAIEPAGLDAGAPAESGRASVAPAAAAPATLEEEALLQRWSPMHGGSREAFEAVFNPARVVRSDSDRRAHLLDGYDLRQELRELLLEGQQAHSGIRAGDGDYATLALVGAEAVLFGDRRLSAEEEQAVRSELERLERELPKVPRQYPNLPVGVSLPGQSPSPRRSKSQASSPRRRSTTAKIPSPVKRSSRQLNPLPEEASPFAPRVPDLWEQPDEHADGDQAHNGESSFSKMLLHLKQQAAMEAQAGLPPRSAEGLPSPSHRQGPMGSPIQLPPQALPASPGQEQLLPHKAARSTAIEDASIIFPERPSTIDSTTQSVYPDSMASSGLAAAGLEDQYNKREEAFQISAWSSKGLDWESAGSMEREGGASRADVSLQASSDNSIAMGAMFARRASQLRPFRRGNLRTLAHHPFLPVLPPPAPADQTAAAATPPPAGATAAAPSELPSIPGATVADAHFRRATSRPGSAPDRVAASAEGLSQRTAQDVKAEAAQQGLPADMQAHGPLDLQGVLPSDDDGSSSAVAAEQAALRAMWCAAPYSQQGGATAAAAVQVASLIDHAAQDEWHQYEEGAMQLIEQLTSALAKQHKAGEAQEDSTAAATAAKGPLAWGSSHNTAAPPKPTLSSSRQLSSAGTGSLEHTLPRGAATPCGPHMLMHGLDVLEQNVSAALDPNALTGLSLSRYDEGLMDLMARLVVAPMATKYLFWKKIQSVAQLKQRVMEDRALEQQLHDIAWGASFAPGFAPLPTGSLPPDQATLHASQQPQRSVGGAPPRAAPTQGWSMGALSVLTAPKAAWMDEMAATRHACLGSQQGGEVRGMCTPLRLRPRDDTPQGLAVLAHKHKERSKSARARAAADFCKHAPGLDVLERQWQQQQQQEQQQPEQQPEQERGGEAEPPAMPVHQPLAPPMSITSVGKAAHEAAQALQGQQQDTLQRQLRQQLFPARGQEQLARRLLTLLEARRQSHKAKPPSNSLYIDVHALERDEAEVQRMAAWTIALHKDQLAALHRKQGGTGQSSAHPGTTPGKGVMLGALRTEGAGVSWMHAGPNPKGAAHAYNGRDFFQDTTNPFMYPTRARPARPMHVSARGVRPAEVAASVHEAPLVVMGIAGGIKHGDQLAGGSKALAPKTLLASASSATGSASKGGGGPEASLVKPAADGTTRSTVLLPSLEHTQGTQAGTLVRPASGSKRAASIMLDPTSALTVVAPLPDTSRPQMSREADAAGVGRTHLPSPSGQQRPVRGWHGAGGNAPPLGHVPGLPVRPKVEVQPQPQPQQQQPQWQPPPPQQQQRQRHGQEGEATSNHHSPIEPSAIAGLEHCYGLGGPTPLGPCGVNNTQRWQPAARSGGWGTEGW